MQPQNSLIKFLVDRGYTVFVISWKNPDASMADTTFEDYMMLGPLSALDVIKKITGASKVNVIGYCIGGTLLAIVLSYLASKRDDTVNAAAFFVSLLDFSEVGDTEVFVDEPQLNYIEEQMMERGYLDNRSMASMFNMLRANDLIWSNFVNNYLLGKEPPAFDLLYWNADGTRMAAAALHHRRGDDLARPEWWWGPGQRVSHWGHAGMHAVRCAPATIALDGAVGVDGALARDSG